MTPAMQKTVAWYVVGVIIAGIYAWVRVDQKGGLGEGLRDLKMWRDLAILILAVLLAPFAVMAIGAILFMLIMGLSGNSIQ